MAGYFTPAAPKSYKTPCISLIGMPGVGKSTVGLALAKHLNWSFVDSDYVMESLYGVPLQSVADAMTKDEFLDVEMEVLSSLRLFRTVIGTGGSVVYRDKAMLHLQSLGPVVYLHSPLPLILERIARNPDRGIAIAPGQTIEDLFNERAELYNKYCNCRLSVENLEPAECAKSILHMLRVNNIF